MRLQRRIWIFVVLVLTALLPALRATGAPVITEYPLPQAGGPEEIAAGPDGALWFTEYVSGKIGRITTSGVVTEFPLSNASSSPYDITAGPDGALWFTELSGDIIGRITTSGAITEYPLSAPSGGGQVGPTGITAGPDCALWFAENSRQKIGRITTGVADAGASTISANPTSVVADGSTTSTVTVTLKDACGNPVPGKTVTLAQNASAHSTISAPSGPSDPNGVVTFTATDSTVEQVSYTATDSDDHVTLSHTAVVNFTVGPVSPSNSTITANPTSVPADNSSTSTVTVTLKDAQGHPVTGKAVSLSQGGGHSTVSTPSGPSDATGVVTFTVKDGTAEIVTYTAKDTDDNVTISQMAGVTFTPVTSADTTPPVVQVPADITVNATGPTGAAVVFTATASDPDDAAGPVTCTPHSGSTFPIGTTTVTCTSTDTHGNTGSASFKITVLGALDQLKQLEAAVHGVGKGNQLEERVDKAIKDLGQGKIENTCADLTRFIRLVQEQDDRLSAAERKALIADAQRIRNVLDCAHVEHHGDDEGSHGGDGGGDR